MGDSFSFKQFTVRQDRCGMKVGTDGVLLGAWASGGCRILDIGTGTGLVALMMAQRFPQARVTAVDIDGAACSQARDNVAASPFARRIDVVETRIQDYVSAAPFDCIVANPPYYSFGMRNPDWRRSVARHTDMLSFAELFCSVARLLSGDGVFSIVVPSEAVDAVVEHSCYVGLLLSRRCDIRTTLRRPSRRALLAFAWRRDAALDVREAVLQTADGGRSPWYDALTKDFYL